MDTKALTYAALGTVTTVILYENGIITPIKGLFNWLYSLYFKDKTQELYIKPIDKIYDAILFWIQNQSTNYRNKLIIPNLDNNTFMCDFIPGDKFTTIVENIQVDIYPETDKYSNSEIRIPFRMIFWTKD